MCILISIGEQGDEELHSSSLKKAALMILPTLLCFTVSFTYSLSFWAGFVKVSHSVVSGSLRPHGILQARILEWVDYPFSSLFSWPRNWTGVSCIVGGFFISWVSMEAIQDTGFNPRSGRSPGGGHGNPLQYSGLEDSMESGASWATVHSVAKSHKQLRQLGTHAHISTNA